MAPKPKTTTKAKAKAGGEPAHEADDGPDAALPPPAALSGVAPVAAATATDIISEAVSDAWATIRACAVFNNIDKADPLGIDNTHGKLSGFKAS